jgi:hypothetical protein
MFANIPAYKKILHFLPVLPVYFIITTVSICFTKFYIYNDNNSFLLKIITAPIFYICAIMVIITHTKSMITSPGFVPSGWKPLKPTFNKNENNPTISQDHLFCKKCANMRPVRAHHCKICGHCVMKMDHHCPWIANCVGFENQKYFYQFLFYATLGDFIAAVMLGFQIPNYSPEIGNDKAKVLSTVGEVLEHMFPWIMLITATILATAMTFAIGFLFFFQTKMLMYNSTTIENHVYSDLTNNPFYYEDYKHNLKIVLGDRVIDWFLPKFSACVFNSGFSYCTPRDVNTSTATPSYVQLGDTPESQGNGLSFRSELTP